MRTIAENLQIIKDSVEDIKQAIIDKGGTISGNITTYADAIEALVLGESLPTEVVLSDGPNEDNAKIYNLLFNLYTNNNDFTISSIGKYFGDIIAFNGHPGGYDLSSDGSCVKTDSNGGGAD